MRKYLTIVIGGNYDLFRKWCSENKVAHSHAVYADRPERLYGLEIKPSDVVDLGGASTEIREVLRTRYR